MALAPFVLVSLLIQIAWAYPPNVFPLHHRQGSRNGGSRGLSSLNAAVFGSVVDVEIVFGKQTLFVELDIGSSDTWVVQDGFECITTDDAGNSIVGSQSDCNFAPDKSYKISDTFSQIPVSRANSILPQLTKAGSIFWGILRRRNPKRDSWP